MMTEKNENHDLILGYWRTRGHVQPIRYLLHYTGTPYHEKLYDLGEGPEFSREAWLSEKYTLGLDFPNLPYLIDNTSKHPSGDSLKLTQSRAILRHLGRRLGLAGSTPEQTSLCDLILDQLHDLRVEFNQVCYGRSDQNDFENAKNNFCSQTLRKYLKEFEDFLGRWSRRWLIGDELTIADFQFYEYFDHCWLICDANDYWDDYPRVRALMRQVRELPELKEYFNSEFYRSLPLNAKFAWFGGKVVTRNNSHQK